MAQEELMAAVREVREELRLNRGVYLENREFTREITRRNEKVWQEQLQAWRHIVAELAELRAEHRAQTEALFRILDRFGPGGSEATA